MNIKRLAISVPIAAAVLCAGYFLIKLIAAAPAISMVVLGFIGLVFSVYTCPFWPEEKRKEQ